MDIKKNTVSGCKFIGGAFAVAAIGAAVSLSVAKGIDVCGDGVKAAASEFSRILPSSSPR